MKKRYKNIEKAIRYQWSRNVDITLFGKTYKLSKPIDFTTYTGNANIQKCIIIGRMLLPYAFRVNRDDIVSDIHLV